MLNAKHHNSIRPLYCLIHTLVIGILCDPFIGTGEGYLSPQHTKCFLDAVCNTGMCNVTNDRHLNSLKCLKFLIYGKQIQQTLGRMIPTAITCIQDWNSDIFQLFEVFILTVTDDHGIIADAFKCLYRVIQAFTLFHAASLCSEIFHTGAQLMLRAGK